MGIGDELIVTGRARLAQQSDPRRVVILDRRGQRRWHEAWTGNPRIAKPTETGDFQVMVDGGGARQYIDYRLSTPQKWVWKKWKCPPGELYGIIPDSRAVGHIIVEPTIKAGASPNKKWPYWQQLVDAAPHLPWMQLCPPGRSALRGVARIETKDFRYACGLLASAMAAVLPDGALHHAAAALGVKAVVIQGHYIGPEQTGYDTHTMLHIGEPCGSRIPCRHCTAAMRSIAPEQVLHELEKML